MENNINTSNQRLDFVPPVLGRTSLYIPPLPLGTCSCFHVLYLVSYFYQGSHYSGDVLQGVHQGVDPGVDQGGLNLVVFSWADDSVVSLNVQLLLLCIQDLRIHVLRRPRHIKPTGHLFWMADCKTRGKSQLKRDLSEMSTLNIPESHRLKTGDLLLLLNLKLITCRLCRFSRMPYHV